MFFLSFFFSVIVIVVVVPDHMIGISNGLYIFVRLCAFSVNSDRFVVVVAIFVISFLFLLANFMVISIFTCLWIPLVIYISSYSTKKSNKMETK